MHDLQEFPPAPPSDTPETIRNFVRNMLLVFHLPDGQITPKGILQRRAWLLDLMASIMETAPPELIILILRALVYGALGWDELKEEHLWLTGQDARACDLKVRNLISANPPAPPMQRQSFIKTPPVDAILYGRYIRTVLSHVSLHCFQHSLSRLLSTNPSQRERFPADIINQINLLSEITRAFLMLPLTDSISQELRIEIAELFECLSRLDSVIPHARRLVNTLRKETPIAKHCFLYRCFFTDMQNAINFAEVESALKRARINDLDPLLNIFMSDNTVRLATLLLVSGDSPPAHRFMDRLKLILEAIMPKQVSHDSYLIPYWFWETVLSFYYSQDVYRNLVILLINEQLEKDKVFYETDYVKKIRILYMVLERLNQTFEMSPPESPIKIQLGSILGLIREALLQDRGVPFKKHLDAADDLFEGIEDGDLLPCAANALPSFYQCPESQTPKSLSQLASVSPNFTAEGVVDPNFVDEFVSSLFSKANRAEDASEQLKNALARLQNPLPDATKRALMEALVFHLHPFHSGIDGLQGLLKEPEQTFSSVQTCTMLLRKHCSKKLSNKMPIPCNPPPTFDISIYDLYINALKSYFVLQLLYASQAENNAHTSLVKALLEYPIIFQMTFEEAITIGQLISLISNSTDPQLKQFIPSLESISKYAIPSHCDWLARFHAVVVNADSSFDNFTEFKLLLSICQDGHDALPNIFMYNNNLFEMIYQLACKGSPSAVAMKLQLILMALNTDQPTGISIAFIKLIFADLVTNGSNGPLRDNIIAMVQNHFLQPNFPDIAVNDIRDKVLQPTDNFRLAWAMCCYLTQKESIEQRMLLFNSALPFLSASQGIFENFNNCLGQVSVPSRGLELFSTYSVRILPLVIQNHPVY